MREHEVPTHVQAEDKVLLWLTFPQVVSLIAVAAAGYGVFNYAPGPTGLRIGLAAVVAVIGAVAAVGQIGGRRLPLVVADLLKYWLGARRFSGEVGELLRPAPLMAVESEPGLIERVQEKGKRRFRRLCRSRDRRNGDRPDQRSGGSKGRNGKGSKPQKRERRAGRMPLGRRRWAAGVAMALLGVAMAIPQAALAQGEGDEGGYRISEIDIEFLPPVLGRRVYVEGVSVSQDRVHVAVRAATDINLRVRAYGGEGGGALRYAGMASLDEGETATFNMPLSGYNPSITLSWVDSLGQAGAFSLSGDQIPYPLPSVDGELCDAEVTSLGWSRTTVSGTVTTDCERQVMETLELQTVSGRDPVRVRTVREAEVTGITGRVNVDVGSRTAQVPLVPGGDSQFSVVASLTEGSHNVSVELDLRGALTVPVPPLVRLRDVPERTEPQAHIVSVLRPGRSKLVYETVTVFHEDGTATNHRISARLSIPSEQVSVSTQVPVTYSAYVAAEIVERDPYIRSRDETIELESTAWADAPFVVLKIPEPEPAQEEVEQVRASDGVLEDLFGSLDWEWPW